MAVPTQKVELKFGASGWVDVSSDAGNISINRGTNRVMDDYQAGSLQITFTNNNRRFDPLNTSSDLWYSAGGYSIVQPAGNIRVTTNSTIVFYGYVQDWSFTYDSAGLDGNASVTAGDLMYYLSRVNYKASTEPGGSFTGDRIADTLYNYGLPTGNTNRQNVKTIIGKDVHATGDNVLSYLQQVARSSPGDLFASASSSATLIFKDKTFTNYLWRTEYRRNLIKYPSTTTLDTTDVFAKTIAGDASGDGWVTAYIPSSVVTPLYPGKATFADNNLSFGTGGTTYPYCFYYKETDQTKYNPGTATDIGYSFSTWVRGSALTTGAGVVSSFRLNDADSNVLVPTVYATATAADSTTWVQLSGSAIYSGTGIVAGVDWFLLAGGTTSGYSFYSNGWQIENRDTYNGVYFDGSYKQVDSNATIRYEVGWTGSKYASDSVLAICAYNYTTTPVYRTFADDNSQGTAYGNGTAIPFVSLHVANSGLNLYTQTQIVGTNATATVTDTNGTALYGLRTYSQTDNLTTSVTRPKQIASEALGYWRLPEYRVESFDVALESLTSAQQNIVLGLELADVIRLCFQPSGQGSIVDKYYQILSITSNADVEREHISFQVASLDNVPIRVDSPLTAVLNSSILA
jgi:hypothetical protein